MNHKNNKRSESTKNKIKATLVEMLKEQELSKITVRALCERANINRSTFYNHYNSPEAILNHIQRDFSTTLAFHIQNAHKTCQQTDRLNALQELFTNILSFVKDHLELCLVLSNTSLCPDFANILVNDSVIVEAFRGAFPETYSDEDRDYIRNFIFFGSFHAMDMWMKNNCDRPAEEIAKLITDIIAKFY